LIVARREDGLVLAMRATVLTATSSARTMVTSDQSKARVEVDAA
jgi:hypothetical protein